MSCCYLSKYTVYCILLTYVQSLVHIEAVKFYTGLPNYDVILAVFGYLQSKVSEPFGRAPKMVLEDEFLASLMRLRLGLLI